MKQQDCAEVLFILSIPVSLCFVLVEASKGNLSLRTGTSLRYCNRLKCLSYYGNVWGQTKAGSPLFV